jgi:four helix bundle protein
MVLRVEDLDIYQMAEELSDRVWEICIKWDYFAKDTIGKQLVRSTDSISANLAEGHGRYHFNDRLKYCYYARGSLEETKSWLNWSITMKFIQCRVPNTQYRVPNTQYRVPNTQYRVSNTKERSDVHFIFNLHC